jgi:hypothetical protein
VEAITGEDNYEQMVRSGVASGFQPILDPEAGHSPEMAYIARHQGEIAREYDGGDPKVGLVQATALGFKPCPQRPVHFGSHFVKRNDFLCSEYDLSNSIL